MPKANILRKLLNKQTTHTDIQEKQRLVEKLLYPSHIGERHQQNGGVFAPRASDVCGWVLLCFYPAKGMPVISCVMCPNPFNFSINEKNSNTFCKILPKVYSTILSFCISYRIILCKATSFLILSSCDQYICPISSSSCIGKCEK